MQKDTQYKRAFLFKSALAVSLICILVGPAASQTAVDSTRLVRVLSYNILHGATINNDFDLERIASVIRMAQPDLVALQEVDFKTERSHKIDLATELGYRTGMAPLFARAMEYDGGEYGEAILSRYTYIKTVNNALPHAPNHEPRAALEVIVNIPSGDEIVFIGTHLDHTRDQSDRIAQTKRINDLFSAYTIPTILAGDLNSAPNSEPMRILLQYWTDASAHDPQPTFPSSNPDRRIDYVLFLPADRWRVIETRVIDEKIASDHRPLLVVLELLPKKNRY